MARCGDTGIKCGWPKANQKLRIMEIMKTKELFCKSVSGQGDGENFCWKLDFQASVLSYLMFLCCIIAPMGACQNGENISFAGHIS